MAGERGAVFFTRRQMLIGGGVGVGLVLAWSVWPRSYEPNLRAAPGETLFNAFLKIGSDGSVVVAVPQLELGQGVYTTLPQVLADELGADWRTVSVEPSPVSPLYANRLLAGEIGEQDWPSFLRGAGRWVASEYAARNSLMVTGFSTSMRAFEAPMREAGAAARALLSKAAAARWDVDWEDLDTQAGFVVHGKEKIPFAELAHVAADHRIPRHLPVRGGTSGRLAGEPLPRLDLPSKVDGSAQYAADIRLPDMLFASIRQGPSGDSRLIAAHRKEASSFPGVVRIVERPGWIAAVAANWWAANRAIELLVPRFETHGVLASSEAVERSLRAALATDGESFVTRGNAAAALQGDGVFRATYSAGLIPTAALETLAVTARVSGDGVEVWTAAQAPGEARAAAARAAGVGEGRVTLYRTMAGGGYGRRFEPAAIEQAVAIAQEVKRPVQLLWSRVEDIMHDSFRPPARAEMTAGLEPGGSLLAWQARIAAPATLSEVMGRAFEGRPGRSDKAELAAVDGADPPYDIAAVRIDHHPAAIGVPTGLWRSRAHSYTAFFTECFMDELAHQANVEPLSFRMQSLGNNPRLARCFQTAAQLGGWDGGGSGSEMGLAGHSAFGSHVATVVEIERGAEGLRVARAVCAVDCGRVVNPEVVKQQIEGGVMAGVANALGKAIRVEDGLPTARSFADLALPTLASAPEVTVELLPSEEDPGGVTELGVPPVAPAIANALFSSTGNRVRSLPLAGTS